MKRTDRIILLVLPAIALLAGFYFLVLGPKRESASKLGEEVSSLQSQISEQNEVVSFAEQARQDFPKYYSRVVVLGKAVPEQADTSSMLVQLSSLSERSRVDFRSIALGEGAGGAASVPEPAPATPPAGEPAPGGEEGSAEAGTGASGENVPTGGAPSATDAPQPATEATAATLPIGATVGPAGLATMPYELGFTGSFFDVTNFLTGVDELVKLRAGSQVVADGRLLTIDGFSLVGGAPGSSPELEATFALTSYVTPPGEGATLGATPGGPAPVPAQPPTTPTSTVSP